MRHISLKAITKSAPLIYPLIIIIVIPALLVFNTLWNLNTFNRDVNYFIRHQAVSIADTIKPYIVDSLTGKQELSYVLTAAKKSNSDIVSLALLQRTDGDIALLAHTNINEASQKDLEDPLNQLALSMNQSFAGLVYNPFISQNVWSVVVPLTIDKSNNYILRVVLKTEAVDAILSRTSQDSFIVLAGTVLASLLLLINHFIFYQKAAKAQQLSELDKLKDEFISMASHELRTPVTALVGYLHLLKTHLPPEAVSGVEKDFTALDSITRHLSELINDLLEVSRIEQGRLKMTLSQADVNKELTEVVRTLAPLAEQKSLALSFSPVTLPLINTDPERFRQIATNLINNAIKYTQKGSVTVSAIQEGVSIKVTVKDTGIGIPPESMEKLYTKFYRVKDTKTANVQGSGLGLWITRQMVEMLGGKLFAESLYGTGSIFSFTLPLRNG